MKNINSTKVDTQASVKGILSLSWTDQFNYFWERAYIRKDNRSIDSNVHTEQPVKQVPMQLDLGEPQKFFFEPTPVCSRFTDKI